MCRGGGRETREEPPAVSGERHMVQTRVAAVEMLRSVGLLGLFEATNRICSVLVGCMGFEV